jgi:hypothetical protein
VCTGFFFTDCKTVLFSSGLSNQFDTDCGLQIRKLASIRSGHPAAARSYMGVGVMVDRKEFGLIHYTDGSRITQISD